MLNVGKCEHFKREGVNFLYFWALSLSTLSSGVFSVEMKHLSWLFAWPQVAKGTAKWAFAFGVGHELSRRPGSGCSLLWQCYMTFHIKNWKWKSRNKLVALVKGTFFFSRNGSIPVSTSCRWTWSMLVQIGVSMPTNTVICGISPPPPSPQSA